MPDRTFSIIIDLIARKEQAEKSLAALIFDLKRIEQGAKSAAKELEHLQAVQAKRSELTRAITESLYKTVEAERQLQAERLEQMGKLRNVILSVSDRETVRGLIIEERAINEVYREREQQIRTLSSVLERFQRTGKLTTRDREAIAGTFLSAEQIDQINRYSQAVERLKEKESQLNQEYKERERLYRSTRAALRELTGVQEHELARQLRQEMPLERARQVSASVEELRNQHARLRELMNNMRVTSNILATMSMKLTFIGFDLIAMGGSLLASFMGLASKEAKRLQEFGLIGDEILQRWGRAQEQLEQTQQRLGRAAMQAVIPLLERVSEYLTRLAEFAERNPELFRKAVDLAAAMLITGTAARIIAGLLNAASLLVSAGDLLMRIVTSTAVKQIITSLMSAAGLSGLATGEIAAMAAALIGKAIVLGVAAYVGANIGMALGNALGRAVYGAEWTDQSLKDVGNTLWMMGVLIRFNFQRSLEALGLAAKGSAAELWRQMVATKEVTQSADQAAQSLSSIPLDVLTKAADEYQNYLQRIEEEDQRFAQRLEEIERDKNASIESEAHNHAQRMQAIQDDLNARLASLAQDLQADLERMSREYEDRRAKIIRDSEDRIAEIRRESQERLRKLEMEHNQRMEELANQRDALGMAQEMRRYQERVEEERRQAAEEIRSAREERERRLQELREQYEAERRERIAQYELQRAEAIQRAEQERKEEQERYEKRMEEIRNQYAQEMEELRKQHNNEIEEIRRAFEIRLRTLGIYLRGEFEYYRAHYQSILDETINFLRRMNAIFVDEYGNILSSAQIPGKQTGGYAGPGLYRVEPGFREFVLNPATTRAAESILGGRLSQSAILSALRRGATYNSRQMIVVNVGGGMTIAQVRDMISQGGREILKAIENAIA